MAEASRIYSVGLTGGIASGKSTAAEAFAALGVPVLDADIAARDVLAADTPGLREVFAAFGSDVLAADGSLDRAALRARVFADADARGRLEAIVHPRVRTLLDARLHALRAPYALLVIPLLHETWPDYAWLDRVLVVDVARELQRARLLLRDGINDALADAMLAAQASRAQRLQLAQDVLHNDGDLASLRQQVSALHVRYLALAQQDSRR